MQLRYVTAILFLTAGVLAADIVYPPYNPTGFLTQAITFTGVNGYASSQEDFTVLSTAPVIVYPDYHSIIEETTTVPDGNGGTIVLHYQASGSLQLPPICDPKTFCMSSASASYSVLGPNGYGFGDSSILDEVCFGNGGCSEGVGAPKFFDVYRPTILDPGHYTVKYELGAYASDPYATATTNSLSLQILAISGTIAPGFVALPAITATPEPAAWALFGSGLGLLLVLGYRRHRLTSSRFPTPHFSPRGSRRS